MYNRSERPVCQSLAWKHGRGFDFCNSYIIRKHSKPEYMDTRDGDRILMLLPFYHGYAFGTVVLGLYSNGTVILMPAFEPKLFLTLIQEHRITHLPLVPPVLTFLAKHPLVEKYDFRSVRELICGAAPLAKDVSFLLSSWSLSYPYLPNPPPAKLSRQEKQPSAGLSAEVSPRCRGCGERIERRTARRKSRRVVAFSLDTARGVTLSRSFLFNRFTKSLWRSRGRRK